MTKPTIADPWGDTIESSSAEALAPTSRSVGREIWLHFSRRPSVLIGLAMIVLLAGFAFLGPLFTGYSVAEQQLTKANVPPYFGVTELDLGDGVQRAFYVTTNLKVLPLEGSGHLGEPLPTLGEDPAKKEIWFSVPGAPSGSRITLSYDWAPASLVGADGMPYSITRTVWNPDHLLGTDSLGRDLLTRLMFGTQISLTVAFVAALINLTIGVIFGSISGYRGGRTDAVMMRIVDIIDTIPLTLYVILIMVYLNSGFLSIILALSSVYWVQMARIVRGQVHTLKQQEYVIAAKTIGSSTLTIMRQHLLPNAIGPILVTATMLIPTAIFIEAFLSFIGLGIAAPMASLGTMCNDAVQSLRSSPYQLALPSIVICLVMFAFTFVGDGMRDALDPKLRRRR